MNPSNFPAGHDPELSAARLAVTALRLQLTGAKWPGPGDAVCGLTAKPIHPGDLYMPRVRSVSFMDGHATVPSPVISGYAAAVTANPVLLRVHNMVFSHAGAYPLDKRVARAWFFLDPPEPPFAAMFADRRTQHLIWRTPLCWSREDIVFRYGASLLRCRRSRLQKAVADLAACAVRPFIGLTLQSGGMARFSPKADAATRELFGDLTRGEMFALSVFNVSGPVQAARPDPITSVKKAKKP